MNLPLKKLRIGKVDGKHEYLTPESERDQGTFDTFLVPDSVEPDRLHNGDIFFVEGFRGTGKTSLLRWHAHSTRSKDAVTDFILFKTDLTEDQRMHLSKEVGVSWTDIDAQSMEISQDFKSAWGWFIVHKIGENLKANPDLVGIGSDGVKSKITRLLGLNDDNIFQKAIGFMPRLEGAHVKIKADIEFFEAELGAEFKKHNSQGKVSLEALAKRVSALISSLEIVRPLYIYFDELEAFYHTPEQHKRDQRLVRDLLFTIASVNEKFRRAKINIHIIGAVRSEVIDSMGSLGQEVDRLVHDKGFLISWHHTNRSTTHPLIDIISRKINFSEKLENIDSDQDPIANYFPSSVDGVPLEAFLLDKSFYKPRDIVWRLSLAQKIFPNNDFFSQSILHDTEIEYSSKLWDEVRYELSAIYSDNEIECIEKILSGGAAYFNIGDIKTRFDEYAAKSKIASKLIERRSVEEILSDLYRIGAIGNAFRTATTGTHMRYRWIYRGEQTLLSDKQMVIHFALHKRLSIIAPRRRGTRSGSRKN